jgi:hypothetical protein
MSKNDYLSSSSIIKSRKDRILLEEEDLVYEYFRLMARKDIHHFLNLFTKDAIIHDPFSKRGYRAANASHIIITMMMRMYDLMYYHPSYQKLPNKWYIDCYHNENCSITCEFRTVHKIKILFTFKFGYDHEDKYSPNNMRIKFLHILLMQ